MHSLCLMTTDLVTAEETTSTQHHQYSWNLIHQIPLAKKRFVCLFATKQIHRNLLLLWYSKRKQATSFNLAFAISDFLKFFKLYMKIFSFSLEKINQWSAYCKTIILTHFFVHFKFCPLWVSIYMLLFCLILFDYLIICHWTFIISFNVLLSLCRYSRQQSLTLVCVIICLLHSSQTCLNFKPWSTSKAAYKYKRKRSRIQNKYILPVISLICDCLI